MPRSFPLIFGHLVMLFLICHAAYYSVERVLYLDGSYYLFETIQQNHPFFAGRASAWLFLLFPAIGVWVGASLKVVVLLYSLSFPIIFYAVFSICGHLNKKPWWALLVPLSLILTTKITAYYFVSEIIHAQVFGVLFACILFSRKNLDPKNIAALTAAGLLCFLGHPAALFIMLAAVALKWNEDRKSLSTPFTIGICLLVAYSLRVFLAQGEGEFFARLTDANLWLSFTKSNALRYLNPAGDHGLQYFILPLSALALFIWGVIVKRTPAVLITTGAAGAYLLMNAIVYHEGDSAEVLEKSWLPVITLILLSLPILIQKGGKLSRGLAIVLILCFSSLSLQRLSKAGRQAKERLAEIERIYDVTQVLGIRKAQLGPSHIQYPNYGPTWALSLESLLYTGIEFKHQSSFYLVEPGSSYATDIIGFVGPKFLGVVPIEDINDKYFELPNSPYQALPLN